MENILSEMAIRIFKDLYSYSDEKIDDTFIRVSKEFGNEADQKKSLELLRKNIWRPNSPVFFSAGTDKKVMSACFPAGAPVIVDGCNVVPIEKICIGDNVLTDKNHYKKVKETMKREYSGKLVKIKAPGVLNEIVVTEEHPFLVLDKSTILCKRNKNQVCFFGNIHPNCFKCKDKHKEDCIPQEQKLVWKKAKDLVEGDYLSISYDNQVINKEYIDIKEYVPFIDGRTNKYLKNDIIPVDNDLMRLFGYYLSEGDNNCGNGLRFTFSLYKEKELEYCNDIRKIIMDKFGIDCVIKEWPTSGTRVVCVHSTVLSKLFVSILGKGFSCKILPNWIMTLDKDLQRNLLIGVFRGDGYLTKSGYIGLSLANYGLIIQIWNLLMRQGLFFNLRKKGISKNDFWNHSDAYTLDCTSKECNDIIYDIWNEKSSFRYVSKYSKKFDDKFLTKITNITTSNYNGDVYNIEVEDDHTYTICNINVHNCWVVTITDSMDSIYDIANVARKIFQSGAGIGIPIGNLREKNAYIYEGKDKKEDDAPQGRSSGAISFMSLFDAVGATTKSGGRARRAAIMCSMPVNHPDIIDFIECKSVDGKLSNMNISVGITDEFMKAFKDNIPIPLVSPSNGVVREANARFIWDKIVDMSWKTADPGILFMDTINRMNPLKKIMSVEVTNPCLTGDTLISTDKGLVQIKDVTTEHKVYSYDIENNVYEYDDIFWCGLTKFNVDIMELVISDNGKEHLLTCTPDHKIYTRNRGFVKAEDLTEDDDIEVQREGF